MPFFSVIIPTFNRAPLLKNLLDSFSKQTFDDFELLVIDDGGTDPSEEIVTSFNDKRFKYFKKENGGVSSARNSGLEKASGSFINFFDSDDMAYPNHLEEAYKFLTSHAEVSVAIFDYEWGDIDKKNYRLISNKYKEPNKQILKKNYISTNCIFIHRKLTDALRFNINLNISEDWDYWIRLSALTKFYLVNITTSYIIEHDKRGVKNINLSSLIAQKDHFIDSLKKDPAIIGVKDFNLKIIASHFNSFIALNAALVGKKKTSVAYFWKSLYLHFPSLFSRRSLAIIKHLLYTW